MIDDVSAWKLGVILGKITVIERAYFLYFDKSEPVQVEAEIAAERIRSGPRKALTQALRAYRVNSRWLETGTYDPEKTAKRSRYARAQIEIARRYNAELPKLIAGLGDVPAKLKAGFGNDETSAFCADFFLGLVHGQGEAPAYAPRQAA